MRRLREVGRGQDERATQERDRDDGDHERPGGPDGAPEDLLPEVAEPRPVIVPMGPVRDDRCIDPLIEVRGRRRRRQAAEQRQESRGPADLGRAGRASFDVGREAGSVPLEEVVHEERVDQAARGSVIERPMGGRRLAHIL